MGRQPGHDGTGGAPGPDPLPGGTPEPGPVPLPPRGAPGIPAAGPAGTAVPPAGPAGTAVPSGFGLGGQWDACAPSAALAVAVEAAAGPGWLCDGLTRDGMVGLLRQWQAVESWAAAGKLGVLRALIRDEDQPLPGGSYRGGLPEGWTKSLTHEVAAALAVSVTSAENLMWLAWDLHVRLPATGELLAAGELTLAKARAVDQALAPLTDQDAAAAEALIIPELGGKTHSQVAGLAAQAAVTVDPESATRRREEAERTRSRVLMFREESGAAGLSGRDLPTDQALAAHARVCERAAEYHDCGVFGEARMDQLRATAYLDLINGTTAEARITAGHLATQTPPGTAASDGHRAAHTTIADSGPRPASEKVGQGNDDPGPVSDEGGAGNDDPGTACGDGGPGSGTLGNAGGIRPGTADSRDADAPGSGDAHGPGSGDADRGPTSGDPRSDDPRGDDPGSGGPSGGRPPGSSPPDTGPAGPAGPAPATGATGPSSPPRLADLVLPLATLLGLAERPGEGHGLGPLDPSLVRDLAGAATASPHTRLCITVTNQDGIAIGHGCARPARRRKNSPDTGNTSAGRAAGPGLPARIQLTITESRLKHLAQAAEDLGQAAGPPGTSVWQLTPDDQPRPPGGAGTPGICGPPGGAGTWTLTLPDGRRLAIALEPMPTFDCDHRHETHAYQPNDMLRHLVQVRDGECTFPPCSRHARDTDFEHATPYDKGGRTCSCNAGSRSRQCHRVKQSPGWNVAQPRPGWHEWTTPAERTYVQGPKRYPV
jgi:hypothetical protein